MKTSNISCRTNAMATGGMRNGGDEGSSFTLYSLSLLSFFNPQKCLFSVTSKVKRRTEEKKLFSSFFFF